MNFKLKFELSFGQKESAKNKKDKKQIVDLEKEKEVEILTYKAKKSEKIDLAINDNLEIELLPVKQSEQEKEVFLPEIFIKKEVLQKIRVHAKSNDYEVGGFLLGEYQEKCNKIMIKESLEAKEAISQATSFTFTHKSWQYLHKYLEEQNCFYKLVGWYHSHPGFGLFYSKYDLFIQKNFFAGATMLGLVIDSYIQTDVSKLDDLKVFQWVHALLQERFVKIV